MFTVQVYKKTVLYKHVTVSLVDTDLTRRRKNCWIVALSRAMLFCPFEAALFAAPFWIILVVYPDILPFVLEL